MQKAKISKKYLSFLIVGAMILFAVGTNFASLGGVGRFFNNSVPIQTASAANLSGGTGTEADPFLVATVADLQAMAEETAFLADGLYFRLEANIVWNTGFAPIGATAANPFRGTFDGNGHYIEYTHTAGGGLRGLFGVTDGATIRNLTVIADVTAANNSGLVVGQAVGTVGTTVENCVVYGRITSSGTTGGGVGAIIGHSPTAASGLNRISNSMVFAAVRATSTANPALGPGNTGAGAAAGGVSGVFRSLEITDTLFVGETSWARANGDFVGYIAGVPVVSNNAAVSLTIEGTYAYGTSFDSAGDSVAGLALSTNSQQGQSGLVRIGYANDDDPTVTRNQVKSGTLMDGRFVQRAGSYPQVRMTEGEGVLAAQHYIRVEKESGLNLSISHGGIDHYFQEYVIGDGSSIYTLRFLRIPPATGVLAMFRPVPVGAYELSVDGVVEGNIFITADDIANSRAVGIAAAVIPWGEVTSNITGNYYVGREVVFTATVTNWTQLTTPTVVAELNETAVTLVAEGNGVFTYTFTPLATSVGNTFEVFVDGEQLGSTITFDVVILVPVGTVTSSVTDFYEGNPATFTATITNWNEFNPAPTVTATLNGTSVTLVNIDDGVFTYTFTPTTASTDNAFIVSADGTQIGTTITFDVTASPFAGGTGTAASPFLISTAEQLNSVRLYPTRYFALTADIDLSSFSDWNPIGGRAGGQPAVNFSGTFSGMGFTIYNLRVVGAGGNSSLFGVVNGATIRNLTVSGVIAGEGNAGMLTGNAAGATLIENVFVKGSVNGAATVGGVSGVLSGAGTLRNVYSAVSVNSTSNNVGGLVGAIMGTGVRTIEDSIFAGTLRGGPNRGALVGNVMNGSTLNIRNSYFLNPIANPIGDAPSNHAIGQVMPQTVETPTAGQVAGTVNGVTVTEIGGEIDRDELDTALDAASVGMLTAAEFISGDLELSEAFDQNVGEFPTLRMRTGLTTFGNALGGQNTVRITSESIGMEVVLIYSGSPSYTIRLQEIEDGVYVFVGVPNGTFLATLREGVVPIGQRAIVIETFDFDYDGELERMPINLTGVRIADAPVSGTIILNFIGGNVNANTFQLTGLTVPSNAFAIFVWESSNENVATINADTGLMQLTGFGTTTITLSVAGTDISETLIVRVYAPLILMNITSSTNISAEAGSATSQITYMINTNARNAVTFTSSNIAVATVSATGEITFVGEGTAVITVAGVDNPSVSASVTVTVTASDICSYPPPSGCGSSSVVAAMLTLIAVAGVFVFIKRKQ